MRAHNFRDLTGQTFSRLTVIEFAETRKGQSYWNCICQCGSRLVVMSPNLTRGFTKSCGCLHKEILISTRSTLGYFGDKSSVEYRTWAAMIGRCENPKTKKYPLYGGRGISVCPRWRKSFEAFRADMGERPGPLYSIDRYPDPDGNYEPSNCRWATAKEQRHNRSKR